MERKGVSRREFSAGLLTAASMPAALTACEGGNGGPSYEGLVSSTWRHTTEKPVTKLALNKELVRYATLAPNSHNSQPWLFVIEANRIVVLPDLSRRCAAVDPDDHHLFVSLGCATENIVLAAAAFGLNADVSVDERDNGQIIVDLSPGTTARSALFQAIPDRQSTRAIYDGKRLANDELSSLARAASSDSVDARILTDRGQLESILEYVVAGNTAQMNDAAFVDELVHWIRFNEKTVVKHRDGLFSASSGNPTAPSWLAKVLFGIAFTESGENDKYRDHIRSSAGVIAFIAEADTKESWINVGRNCQRFSLQATALGIRQAYINQPVEVPNVRQQFADHLGIGSQRPNLLLRFGRGPTLPRSLRRPVQEVLVKA